MAGSFRRSLIAIAVLTALACAGAIVAMWHLAKTTTEQRTARAEDTVTLEVARLQEVLGAEPHGERGRQGKHTGELRSGYIEAPGRGDRAPYVTEAVRRAQAGGSLVVFDEVQEDGTPVVVAAAPVTGGGFAFAVLRVVTGRETRTLREAVLALALLSLVLVAVSLRTVVAVDRGVSMLRGSLSAVAKDLSAPVVRPKVRELGEIADGVASLAQELARTQKERERLTLELAAKERLAALGRVAAGIAHEVRNPLAAMKLRADLARSSGEATPAIASDLSDIASEITRLDRLVSDLLVVAGRRSGPKADVDLGDLVGQRVRLLAPWAAEKGVAVSNLGAARAHVDADAIARVVDNLLRNAVEASPRGASVRVSVVPYAEGVELAVVDAGAGVPKEHVAELFEPFFTTKNEGTGLGLALARAVANAHDGTLTYAHEAEATCFTLRLPARVPPAAAEPSS